MLAASSPKLLDHAIDLLLNALVEIFAASAFKINWSKGKTESMLVYRGCGAAIAMDRRRRNGDIHISLPKGAGAEYMH
eukprot:3132237-Karenia_brevis.AAC.1